MLSKDFCNKTKQLVASTKFWIVICALGIWMIVFQNFGLFGKRSQKVYVTGGYVTADVNGSVEVTNDNLSVTGDVDVNIEEVLGDPIGCHRSYTIDGRDYWAIDVYSR